MPKRSSRVPKQSVRPETVSRIIDMELKVPFIRPSQTDIDRFAALMEDLRQTVDGVRSRLPEQMARNARVRDALHALRNDLPILIDERKKLVRRVGTRTSAGPIPFATWATRELQILRPLLTAAKHLSDSNIAIDLSPLASMLGWQRIALQIAVQFTFLLEGSNRGRRIGNAGPVPRFVSAMLIHVSGDKVESETVKAMLKASKKVGLSELMTKKQGKARSAKIPG